MGGSIFRTPQTWLNQGRWEDELPKGESSNPFLDMLEEAGFMTRQETVSHPLAILRAAFPSFYKGNGAEVIMEGIVSPLERHVPGTMPPTWWPGP